MRTLASLILVLTLTAACATLPANPTDMTAEQLNAWAKDKNANISCGVINSPYGRGVAVYVVLDKGIVINGTVVVDDQCRVTISNAPAPPK